MLAATHALVGALCATQFNNPTIGLVIAASSHPFMDLFPHWDFNSRWSKLTKSQKFIISCADSCVGMGIGFFFFGTLQNWKFLLAAMLIAQWPDFLEAPYHFGFERHRFFKGIKQLQHLWHTKAVWPWGFLPQLGILLFAIWVRFH